MENQKVLKIIGYAFVSAFFLPFVVFAFFVQFRLFALVPPMFLLPLFYNGVRVKGQEQLVEFSCLEEKE